MENVATATEPQTISMCEEVIIRAPTFTRLIKHISDFKKTTNMFDDVLIDTTKEIANDDLNEIFKNIFNEANIYQTFPVNDMDMLSGLFMKVIRFYVNEGGLHNKIIMCYAMQKSFGLWMQSEELYEKSKRSEEVVELNNKFYELSKKIKGQIVNTTAEITTNNCHEFSPNSEFVKFTVSYMV